MQREPSPLADLMSLSRLWWFFVNNRFDIIHVSTPKAALLGSIAALLSGHRRVVFTLRGRAYENITGLKRRLFAGMDALICRLACRVNPIARELGEQIVRERLCAPEKIRVMGHGSSNGIDLNQFRRTPDIEQQAKNLRRQFDIGDGETVILCIGRICRDKGINELVRAFEMLASTYSGLHLLLVGRYEEADPLDSDARRVIDTHPRIHYLQWQKEPAAAYAAADILAFPTYREGFGNVVLEASAMKIPVVASDIMGCRESVDRDVTGLLVPPQDVEALRGALDRLIRDPDLRRRMGRQGRRRVKLLFRQEIIWEDLVQQYHDLMQLNYDIAYQREG